MDNALNQEQSVRRPLDRQGLHLWIWLWTLLSYQFPIHRSTSSSCSSECSRLGFSLCDHCNHFCYWLLRLLTRRSMGSCKSANLVRSIHHGDADFIVRPLRTWRNPLTAHDLPSPTDPTCYWMCQGNRKSRHTYACYSLCSCHSSHWLHHLHDRIPYLRDLPCITGENHGPGIASESERVGNYGTL